ncbi:MAG TPA: HEAT repeat domain-containing protein [Terriglobales bacterium]|nr:HEAT repeat domain-containing protein [Terriglobales bacterium]
MKRALLLVSSALFLASLGAGPLWAQVDDDSPALNMFSPQTVNAGKAAEREDELYQDGSDYLNDGKYQEALQKFSAVADMKGKRADAALYWKAYSHNKLSHRNEALATIAELRRQYPQSKWLKDASALELEVKQAQGQRPSADTNGDEELKLLAIQSLMNSDQERAVPMLEQILQSPKNSPRVKDRALFVLAQSDSPRAQQAIANIAKGQQYPELQRKAIQYLGVNGTSQNKRSLVEIYNATNDVAVKRTVIHAFLTCDGKEELLAVVRNERDQDLRRDAIHTMGAMGAHNELHQMFSAAQNDADRKAVIEALGISDDVPFLAQIARTPGTVEVRRAAIHGLGISGEKARAPLVEIYNNDTNPEIRNAAIEGLFINDGDDELIALARKETDPQMKRRIVEKLAVMDTKKSHEYMMEILNK